MRPIRDYLLILVLGAMLPGVLLIVALVWRTIASDRAGVERRLLDSAAVDARSLDREFAGTIRTLDALAISPTLDTGDLRAFYDEARRVQLTQPGWYTVMLLSGDARQLVSSRLPWGTPLLPVTEPGSVQRVIASRGPAVGPIRMASRGGGENLFAVRVPVLRDGALKYVLSAIVNVDSLALVVPPLSSDSTEWTRTILDPEGTIAVRTRGRNGYVGASATDAFRARILRDKEGVSREATRDGQTVYAAFSRASYDWTTVVVVPKSVLDAPARSSIAAVVAGGALLMACGLGAVMIVSRRLSREIAGATRAAEAVAQGRSVRSVDARLTETRRLQSALATAAWLLERRAHERDEEIRRADAARAEAEEANRAKDQFLAVLGHELRNPLAPTLTALELMKARSPDVLTRERQVLERQVAHMVRLVNDLLDISRLARGKIELVRRRFEFCDAAERAVDMVRPIMLSHQHRFDVDVPTDGLPIDGDIDRIVQVVSNLLTNAAHYTPPGGWVCLSARRDGDFVEIHVEDDGPGIPEELRPKLFELFAQGPRTLDRRQGGLGLGLALARRFTELHGGTIRVEARGSDRGSRFVVRLPSAVGAIADVPVDVGPRAHVPHRVLVVDDNVDASAMLAEILSDAGHVVATAADGPSALILAGEFRPDLAILDIGLPGMSGHELAGRLRAASAGLRLIALTGYGQQRDRDAALAAGFDAHCAKPVSAADLLEQIESIMAGARSPS